MSRKYGVGSIYNRGNRLWTCYSVNGKTYRESSGSNKQSVAAALLKKRMAEAQSGRATAAENRQTPVSELLDDVVKYYASYRPKSHWWCRLVVETHLRPFFEFHKAERIGTTQVQKYIESRKKKGRSNATINRELAILRRAFKLAFDHDPPRVSRVPKIKDLPEDNVRTGFFEREPYEKLLAALPPEIKPLLVFGYFTGCRRGEILRLLWNQIDLDRRVVRLNSGETKNNERVIPLAKELVDCLRGHKRERDEFWPGCPYVFHRNGERIRSFKEAWRVACVRAGLVDADGRPQYLFHDLRRTGVRNLVRAGVPDKVAMAISGHKTRAVFDRYQIVRESDLLEAVERLDKAEDAKKQ